MAGEGPSDKSKLAVTLIVIALATFLRYFEKIDAAAWTSAVTWVSSAYMLGQVAAVLAQGWTVQAVAKAGATNAASKASNTV